MPKAIQDYEYEYLTKMIGEEMTDDLPEDSEQMLVRLTNELKIDTTKSIAVYSDLSTRATFPGTVLESIWETCKALRTDDDDYPDYDINILCADDDNQYSFSLIHRVEGCKMCTIRLPDDEDALEAWATGGGMTQQQFDFLKLLGITTVKWERFGMCTKNVRLSTMTIVPTSTSNSKNLALLLGGLGAIALLAT